MAEQVKQMSKAQFLELYGQAYGYSGTIDTLRDKDFCRLEDTYLDHVGATLYAESQIENYCNELKSLIYGNPHSQNASSQRSSEMIEEARNMVARHFHTTLDNHHVVFTSGATGALKLLAENFDWSKESEFLFLEDSHTSVVGIREVAKREGSSFRCITESELEDALSSHDGNLCMHRKEYVAGAEPNDKERLLREDLEGKKARDCNGLNLFSYPAMSNFCGRKYPHSWISLIKQGCLSLCPKQKEKWFVLLDAASYVGTNELNLTETEADFVAISFYKLFGFPTGVGALIIRSDAVVALKPKCYYGGGTVLSTISGIDHHAFKEDIFERLEDGTLPFLDILALKHGFSWLKRNISSMQIINRHVFSIVQYTFRRMKSLVHYNGVYLCKLYHDTEYDNCERQGPIINFNIINENGGYIGYSQVEKLANLSKIHLRTGCFCNTGDCQKHLGVTSDEMLSHFHAGHVCGDQMDIVDGKPTGSVRISFGYMSSFEDAWTFLQFLQDCFLISSDSCLDTQNFPLSTTNVSASKPKMDQSELSAGTEKAPEIELESSKFGFDHQDCFSNTKESGHLQDASRQPIGTLEASEKLVPINKQNGDLVHIANNNPAICTNGRLELKYLLIYPVKSCAPFQVSQWWIGEKGLLYDREWMILTEYGSVLTQKREPKMVFIKPIIDVESNILKLQFQGYNEITVPLDCNSPVQLHAYERQTCSSKVCGDKVTCDDCGDTVAAWISEVLGKPCRLVRQNMDQSRWMRAKDITDLPGVGQHAISLSNESQYLLVSETSLLEMFKQFKRDKNSIQFDELAKSFRANFIVNGDSPFEEDGWKEIKVGKFDFKVIGKCQRCQMICINQSTAEKNKEPLEALIRMRGSKMEFGIYLVSNQMSNEKHLIRVGDSIKPVC